MPDNRIWPSGQNPQGMVAGGSSQGLEMAPMQQMQQMQQLGQHDRGGLSRFYSKQVHPTNGLLRPRPPSDRAQAMLRLIPAPYALIAL